MKTEGDSVTRDSPAPVAEMFGSASAIRAATSGREIWPTEKMGLVPLAPHPLEAVTR